MKIKHKEGFSWLKSAGTQTTLQPMWPPKLCHVLQWPRGKRIRAWSIYPTSVSGLRLVEELQPTPVVSGEARVKPRTQKAAGPGNWTHSILAVHHQSFVYEKELSDCDCKRIGRLMVMPTFIPFPVDKVFEPANLEFARLVSTASSCRSKTSMWGKLSTLSPPK